MKKLIAILAAAALALACAGCGRTDVPAPSNPYEDGGYESEITIEKPEGAIERGGKYIDFVARVGTATGEDALRGSTLPYGIGGTDLGIPFYSPTQERLYFCFGDTYAGSDMSWPWNNNAILYTELFEFSRGIRFDGAVEGIATANNYGRNKLQITPDTELEANYTSGALTRAWHPGTELDVEGQVIDTNTCIPTGAIELGGSIYIFYMEVAGWGFGGTGQWCVHSNRVMKSSDGGKTFSQLPSLQWSYEEAPNFGQIFPVEAGDYVYIYGLRGGRMSSLKTARVKKADFENKDAYEYFVGYDGEEPVFVRGSEGLQYLLADRNENSSVIYGPCGEMTIVYNEYLSKYVALYQMGSSIVLRTSDTPYGPFSEADTVFSNGEFGLNDAYCAFTHPKMADAGGRRIYFLMSVWFPTYNVQLMELVLR